ncbi:MAG: response regulator [Clostridiales bacterium]|nr:response regulator [Clostridiales bacterium]
MLKVMIVDDEPLSRLELVNMIPWRRHGFLMVGTAENGQLALELARTARPDIAIVDIKMPVMDGLTMMRRLQAEQPAIQFIVLTGYAEFQYAQEALRLGAIDYVMKLKVNPDQLLAILNRARERAAPSAVGDSADAVNRRERLARLLGGWYAGDDAAPSPAINADRIACVDLFSASTARLCAEDGRGAALDILSEALRRLRSAGLSGEAVRHAPHRYSLLLRGGGPGAAALEGLIRSTLSKCLDMDVHFGLSDRAGSARQLPSCARQAQARCEQGFWRGAEPLPRQTRPDGAQPIDEDRLLALVRDGDARRVRLLLGSLAQDARGRQPGRAACCAQYERLAYHLGRGAAFYLGDQASPADLAAQSRQFAEYALFTRMTEDMARYCEALCIRMRDRRAPQGRALADALQHMRSHFDAPLKLSDVARVASMNPTYFCTLFKKQTGQRFSQYLNGIRVERAKELLLRSEMTIAEIGAAVGFDSSAYFAKVFKQFTGVQPMQYRNRPS